MLPLLCLVPCACVSARECSAITRDAALCQNSSACLVASPRSSLAITSLSAHTNFAQQPNDPHPFFVSHILFNPHKVCHLHHQLHTSVDNYWLRATRQEFDSLLEQRSLWSCQLAHARFTMKFTI